MLSPGLLETAERFDDWRARSRVAAVGDAVVVAVGAVIVLVVGVDDVVSWFGDRVLLDHRRLAGTMGWVLPPVWLWLIVSLAPVVVRHGALAPEHRLSKRVLFRRAYAPTARAGAALGGLLLACVVIVAGGFVAGAAKGEVRGTAASGYQLSVQGTAGWQPLTPAEYRHWSAELVRLDGLFLAFGFGAVALGSVVRRARRTDLFTALPAQ
ncbi:hypothetical protein ACFYNO_27765 [Kitasatospora sp. NPDC006697]|uniref:hypothetical protein n=1 Tax=Kitasatospora sp. NPDC006697 TaxID=3364020 RepID=UPI00369FF94A